MFAVKTKRASRALALLLALGTLAALAGCGGERAGNRRTVELADCRLPKLPTMARCGELEVPENRERPDGRRIRLAIAILPANTRSPQPDPLFILAGGPGQAATQLGPFAALLVGVRKERDIVLVDQRGTGRSSPLDCAALKPEPRPDAALDFDPVPKARACAAELAARGVDAAQFTTAAWVEDLDAARAALGYERVNLWGGSYGTRVALEYLRRHPDRVRSMVLDGVAPPSLRVSLDIWVTRDAALGAAIAGCRAEAACAAAHPDLDARLEALRARLGAAGRDIAYVDPATGARQPLRLRGEQVVAALHPLTYVPELRALLPEVIERAAQDDYGPLVAAMLMLTGELATQMNAALYFSVTCAEDTPRIAADAAARALAATRTPELAAQMLRACDVWPRGRMPADATTPVRSDVPALLLSGGLDPVTPPAYADEVARTLSSSRHVVAPGYGHIVSHHACGPRLIAAFVEHAALDRLPAGCIEHFTGSVAPAPWPDRMGSRR